jgi:L-malate glycosyltransferase
MLPNQYSKPRQALRDESYMSPIPILLLVRKLDHGGCERDLTKIATGLDRSEFEPHVACFHPVGLRVEELRRAQVPILHLPVTSFRSRSAIQGALTMRRYIKQNKIQVVHAFDVPMSIFGAPVARAAGTAAIFTSQLSYLALYTPTERTLLRIVDRLAHRVVVNCEAMQKHMVIDQGLPLSRTFLCYNGVDTTAFYPRESPRPALLANAPVVIGTVANLREEKGIDVLIRAFARVRRQREAKLFIVGSGPCSEELEELAVTLGVRDDTIFVAGKPDIADELHWMDIFVLPSRSEAFSNSLLEAMASGCAVIGSELGGTPEMINPETGLLFPPGDDIELAARIQTLIDDPERRKRFGAAAARLASGSFSLARNLARVRELYRSRLQP